MRARTVAAALVWLGIACWVGSCSRFTPADPDDKDRMHSCAGVIRALEIHPDGTFALELEPYDSAHELLVHGATIVRCENPDPEHCKVFAAMLKRLRVGQAIEVSGYWVLDRERPQLSLLRPVTSLDMWIEAR